MRCRWTHVDIGDSHAWTQSQLHYKCLILRITDLQFPTCKMRQKEELPHGINEVKSVMCWPGGRSLVELPQLPCGAHSQWEREFHSSVGSGQKGPWAWSTCGQRQVCALSVGHVWTRGGNREESLQCHPKGLGPSWRQLAFQQEVTCILPVRARSVRRRVAWRGEHWVRGCKTVRTP